MTYDKELITAHIRALADAAMDYVDIDSQSAKETLCAALDSIALWAQQLETVMAKEETTA